MAKAVHSDRAAVTARIGPRVRRRARARDGAFWDRKPRADWPQAGVGKGRGPQGY